jgi:thiol-disulfide isomerase/thioredoxin
MKIIIGIMAMLLPMLSRGQQRVTIGDKIPNIQPGNILNYTKPVASVSSIKGKLVLLDFMNTYCSSCIQALPAFDSLQDRYAGRLQIFMVTNESRQRAAHFMKTNPIAKTISLPFIVADSTLEKLFPHAFVSHEVWIYNGVVKAITAGDYVTDENIRTILSGQTPAWEVKTDNGDYDFNAPLLALNDNTGKYVTNNSVYGTVFTPNLKGVGIFYKDEMDSATGIRTIRAINYSIAALYLQVLTDWRNFPKSHVWLQPGNEDRFTYADKKEYYNVWNDKNTYCYEATFPPHTPEAVVRKKIQADLDMYLHVQSSFETIEATCYVLLPDSGFTAASFPAEDYTTLASQASKDDLVFISPDGLVTMLNSRYWGTPFYNGLDEHLHMPVILPGAVLTNTHILETALKQQHILLQKVTRNVDMLLLKENQNNSLTKSQN